jgi:hypothetical protein
MSLLRLHEIRHGFVGVGAVLTFVFDPLQSGTENEVG